MWPAPRRACASRLCGCVDAPDRKSVYLSSWRTYASGGERAQRKSVPERPARGGRETGALLYKLDAKVTRPKCGLAACKTLAKHLSLASGHPAVAPKQYQGRLLIFDVLEKRHLLIRDSGGRSGPPYSGGSARQTWVQFAPTIMDRKPTGTPNKQKGEIICGCAARNESAIVETPPK